MFLEAVSGKLVQSVSTVLRVGHGSLCSPLSLGSQSGVELSPIVPGVIAVTALVKVKGCEKTRRLFHIVTMGDAAAEEKSLELKRLITTGRKVRERRKQGLL
jgi:hypothetical protein